MNSNPPSSDLGDDSTSLTEYIRNKVDNLRETKRLDHKKYLGLLKESIRLKTENVALAHKQFEQAVREYQVLLECRLENFVTLPVPKSFPQPAKVIVNPLSAEQVAEKLGLNEIHDSSVSRETFYDSSIECVSTSSTACENAETISLNYKERIDKARALCLEAKRNYDLLEISLRRANEHVTKLRDTYHQNLLSLNKLEKDLVGVSAGFESKAKVELESSLKSLAIELGDKRNSRSSLSSQDHDEYLANDSRKRKATELPTRAKTSFGNRPQDRTSEMTETEPPSNYPRLDFPAEKTVPVLMLVLTAGFYLASCVPGFI